MTNYQVHPDVYYGVELRDGGSIDDYVAQARGFSKPRSSSNTAMRHPSIARKWVGNGTRTALTATMTGAACSNS
jgi:hypothetical protein